MRKKVKARRGTHFTNEQAVEISVFIDKKFPDGFVTTEKVLTVATPKNSPIHKYFEWNDTEAARRYRLKQASDLISCVVYVEGDNEIRKFCAPIVVEVNEGTENTYIELDTARRSPTIWKQIVDQAMKEALAWRERYQQYKELKPIVETISKVERKRNAKVKRRA